MLSNRETIKVHPRLFCSKCLRRAVKIRISKGTFKNVEYATCPVCNDTDNFFHGAERIIGVIGGDGDGIVQKDGTVYVRLWFDSEKKIRYADIDQMVIRAGCVRYYEQAVNALVLELTGDFSRPVSSTKQIPTNIEDNTQLSEGAMQMLRSDFDLIE